TPHVAGAAAILRQQHPDWTGEQLKAALVAAAQPVPAYTVYQQGGGRVDVDRVTRQQVVAEPATLSLGIASYPHDDDPFLARAVHCRNRGTADVALAIAANLAAGGVAAPPGMIALDPDQLAVPAGGAADLTITIDTRVGDVLGVFGGAVIATTDELRLVTPI